MMHILQTEFDVSFLSRTRPTSCDSRPHTRSHLRHGVRELFSYVNELILPFEVAWSRKGRSPFGGSGTSTRIEFGHTKMVEWILKFWKYYDIYIILIQYPKYWYIIIYEEQDFQNAFCPKFIIIFRKQEKKKLHIIQKIIIRQSVGYEILNKIAKQLLKVC